MAAGHPATAEAGAAVLRAGGNAVDAAVAAVLTSFVAEPLLTGLAAGGYLLVVPPDDDAVLLDFFVEAPGRGLDPADRAPLRAVTIDFGDATQVFHVGAASCGTYGMPAGLAAAVEMFGRAPLAELTAPAARLARAGVRVTPMQAYLYALLAEINAATPAGRARYLPDGRPPREGDLVTDPELAEALDRFGADGPAPFYTGDVAAAVVDVVRGQGGLLGAADLAAYRVIGRSPLRVPYRDATVCLNPPPSAGGALLGRALAELGRTPGPPDAPALVAAMAAAERARTPEFLAELADARGHRAGEPPRVDHTRVGARRRRLGVRRDQLERRRIRRRRPGHRHPPQQRPRRGGPVAAGLPPAASGGAAAVDDGADGGAARRRRPSWSRARPGPTASAAPCCR